MLVGCCGTFDYELHEGHIEFLKFCKSFGDVVVFVVSDATVFINKRHKPVYDQQRRKQGLINSGLVYEVIKLKNTDDKKTILDYGLDFYVFGPDQNSKWNCDLSKLLVYHNTRVIHCNNKKLYSTTELLKEYGLLQEDIRN